MLQEKLVTLMKEKNLNINRLSNDTGIPYSTVSDWVKGNTTPRIDKVALLAQYFNVPIDELICK